MSCCPGPTCWPQLLSPSPTSVYFLCLLSLPHIKFRKPPAVISLLCFPKSGNLQILRTKLEPQDDNFIWKLNPAIEVIWENKKYIWERKKKNQPWGRNLIMVNQSFLVANLPECMLMLWKRANVNNCYSIHRLISSFLHHFSLLITSRDNIQVKAEIRC